MVQQKGPDVSDVVRRILSDTAGCQDERVQLLTAPADRRQQLIDTLRGLDVPVLSTDGACGPG